MIEEEATLTTSAIDPANAQSRSVSYVRFVTDPSEWSRLGLAEPMTSSAFQFDDTTYLIGSAAAALGKALL